MASSSQQEAHHEGGTNFFRAFLALSMYMFCYDTGGFDVGCIIRILKYHLLYSTLLYPLSYILFHIASSLFDTRVPRRETANATDDATAIPTLSFDINIESGNGK